MNVDESVKGEIRDETEESVIPDDDLDVGGPVVVDLGEKVKACEQVIHDLEEENLSLKECVHIKDDDISALKEVITHSQVQQQPTNSVGVKQLKKRNRELEEIIFNLESKLSTKDEIIEQLQHDKDFLEHVHQHFEPEIQNNTQGFFGPQYYFKTADYSQQEKEKVNELKKQNYELNNSLSKLRRYCSLLQEENEKAFKEIKYESQKINQLEMELVRRGKIINNERENFEAFKKESFIALEKVKGENKILNGQVESFKDEVSSLRVEMNEKDYELLELKRKLHGE